MYKIPNRPKRTNIHLYPNYTPKTKILKNSILYKLSEIYCTLPDNLKTIEIKKFKPLLKIHISKTFDQYSFPNTDNDTQTDSDN